MRISSAGFLFLAATLLVNAKQVKITVLATTDLHGNIMPYDYFTGKEAPRGLAKIGTLIGNARKANPNALLIDCGDTIQGSALESYYQQHVTAGKMPAGLSLDPMMLAMNYLRYDAMAVGNHEYNYGLRNLSKARHAAKFPWLSANTKLAPQSRNEPYAPYMVKTVDGVKIAVIGITTPSIPSWEKAENYHGYRFIAGTEGAREAVQELQRNERPDLIIVAAHSGIDRDARTGTIRDNDLPGENIAYQIAADVAGIDAVIFGHTHQQVEQLNAGNVLLVQPKNWGGSLAQIDFTLASQADGHWKVEQKSSRLIPVTAATPADPEIVRMALPYHEAAENYLNTQVAESVVALDASRSRIEDTAILDAIQKVQLHYAKADVSFCAAFNTRASIPKGHVTIRQIAALYVYDNELYAIEGTGRMVREALENSVRYFKTCPTPACDSGPLIDRSFVPFNYDMAEGVSYDVDLTKPVGERIQNLTWRGKPLDDGQKLRIAVNNYRAGGSGGYTMFTGAKLLWRSYEDIRELIIRYYQQMKQMPARADDNWRVTPAAARRVLEQEAQAEAARSGTQ